MSLPNRPSESSEALEVLTSGVATAMHVEGHLPLRWLTVVESIDPDGRRCMWRFNSDGLSPWDALSLLDYAETTERVGLLRSALQG